MLTGSRSLASEIPSLLNFESLYKCQDRDKLSVTQMFFHISSVLTLDAINHKHLQTNMRFLLYIHFKISYDPHTNIEILYLLERGVKTESVGRPPSLHSLSLSLITNHDGCDQIRNSAI